MAQLIRGDSLVVELERIDITDTLRENHTLPVPLVIDGDLIRRVDYNDGRGWLWPLYDATAPGEPAWVRK